MLERLVEMLGGHGLHVGYAFVFFILVLCGFGLPMPEDVVLATGGVLAWLASDLEQVTVGAMLRDHGLLTMVAIGLAGIVAGDSIIFLAGRRFGHRIADIRPLRRIITPAKLESVEKLIRRRGNLVVVIARFLPGLRAPTFFTVGHARMPLWEFLLFDGAAALISAPLWVCLGFWLGSDLRELAAAADARLFVAHDVAPVEQGHGSRERTEARSDDPRGHGREVRPQRKRASLSVEEPIDALVALGRHACIGIREIEHGQDDLAQAGLLEPPDDGILRFAATLGRIEEERLHSAWQVRIGTVRLHAEISGRA